MSPTLQSFLTFLGYAIVFAGSVVGIKYGVIDQNTGSLIIGATLSHLGYIGVPNVVANQKAANGAKTQPLKEG